MEARAPRIRPGRPGALLSIGSPYRSQSMQPAAVAFPAYDFYTTEELLEAYREGPERLRAASAGLSMEQMRARPRPGKWSILEILLHVADSELRAPMRVRCVMAQPGTRLPGYDQKLWTARLHHNE